MLCAFAGPSAVGILPHSDIQDPVDPIFNLPMRPNHAAQALGIVVGGAWESADIVPLLHTRRGPQVADRCHEHETRQTGPTHARLQAIEHSRAPPSACLYPPMAAIDLCIVATRDGLIEGMGA